MPNITSASEATVYQADRIRLMAVARPESRKMEEGSKRKKREEM